VNLRIRRAAATAAVILTLSTALVGCGVGFDAPTEQVSPPYPSGDVGPLVNSSNEPQALRSLQIAPPQTDGGSPAPSPSTPLDVATAITVPAQGAVHVGAQGQPTVTVDGLDAIARPGELVPVTLIFDKAGRITFNVVVQAGTGPFASFAPTAQPTPTTAISPTTSPTASSSG
jgi:hypothetical protein